MKTDDKKNTHNTREEREGDVIDMIMRANGDHAENYFSDDDVVFEGQLAIDMAETPKELVIVSTIAGVEPSDISIHIDHDALTIRGKRSSSFKGSAHDYFYKECYWGVFSRSIMLPVEVKSDEAVADFHNGLLTIRIPKTVAVKEVPIRIIDEE